MSRIFISYARADGSEIAQELTNRLRSLNHEVFLDIHGIPGGTEWEKQLIERAKWCDVLVVLITVASNQSKYVYHEFREAEKNKKFIIPVQVEEAALPPHLTHLNAVPFRDKNYDNLLLKLEVAIRDYAPSSKSGLGTLRVGIFIVVTLVIIGIIAIMIFLNNRNGDANGASIVDNNTVTSTSELPTPTSTDTLVPSETPIPNDTLIPTDTIIPSDTPTRTPHPTRTPLPTSTPIVAGAILVDEDFEDMRAQGFTMEGGTWRYETDETGNIVFAGDQTATSSEYSGLSVGLSTWDNYVIEYRFRLLESGSDPNVFVTFRRNAPSRVTGYIQSFSITGSGGEIYLATTTNGGGWFRLVTKDMKLESDVWYKTKISVSGSYIQIFVDDNLYIEKEYDFIDSGDILFSVGPRNYAQFDDIKVTALGSE